MAKLPPEMNQQVKTVWKLQSLFFALTRFRIYFLRNHSVEAILKDPRVIVLTRLEDVGDMLVFVPVLKNLRRYYPNSLICLITKSRLGRDTIIGCPYIDEVIHLEDSFSGRWRLIRRLRKLKPDIFIVSTQGWGRVKWGFWGGAKIIVGYRSTYEYNDWRKTKLAGFIQYTPSFNSRQTEVERNLELLKILGINHLDTRMDFSWIKRDDQAYVDRLFSEAGLMPEDFIIALAPGTKRKPKAWLPERFSQVADQLAEQYHAKIVILGTSEKAEEAERIGNLMKHPLINFLGSTTLCQLPALIKKLTLLITVDSGPMHFAAAVGVPYVALFGPGEFFKWRHTSDPSRQHNIYKQVECSPCRKEVCHDNRCMKSILVEDVLEECARLKAAGVI